MPSHCPEICSVIFPHFCFTSSCFFSLLLSQSGGGESGRFRVVAAINLVERLRLDLGADRRTSGEGFGLGYRRENHQVLFFFSFLPPLPSLPSLSLLTPPPPSRPPLAAPEVDARLAGVIGISAELLEFLRCCCCRRAFSSGRHWRRDC